MSVYKINIYKKFTFSRNRYQFNTYFKSFNKYYLKIFIKKGLVGKKMCG